MSAPTHSANARSPEPLGGYGYRAMLACIVGMNLVVLVRGVRGSENLPLTGALLGAALAFGAVASGVSRRQRWLAIAVAAFIPIAEFSGDAILELPGNQAFPTLAMSLTVYVLAVTLRHLFRIRHVRADDLAGSVCVYFLLAIFWAFAYQLIYDTVGPEAFRADPSAFADARSHDFFYFSWVTLTTLGYGDITPAHVTARVLANLECFAGQFFIAVLVARLVALYMLDATLSRNGGA